LRQAVAIGLLSFVAAVAGAEPRDREGVRPEDRVDVALVDRQLLAIRAGRGSPVVSVDLELGETVLATESRGLVGVATTSSRLLGVTSRSSRWHELRYRIRERAAPPQEFELGDRIALVALPNRLAGLAPGGTGWIEFQLGPGEVPVRTSARTNVAVAVTARRAIALSAKSGFVSITLFPEESASISVDDSTATLTTDRRVLVFRSGDLAWRELSRRVVP
jgi:hypothetical protein